MAKGTLFLVLVALLYAPAAGAQPPDARITFVQEPVTEVGYVDINLGLQATSTSFASTLHPIVSAEAETVQTTYAVKRAREFDFGGGVHLTPTFALGAALSRFTKGDAGTVDAQVPHPFFFNRARSVSGTANDLTRTETAIHLKAVWMPAVGDGWSLSLSGGPSFFRVGQDLVDAIKISETYPYDTAAFAGVVATRHDVSGLGFNAGADITRLFTSHMGVGVDVAFSRATLHLVSASNTTIDIEAGGLRVGGGLRFRF